MKIKLLLFFFLISTIGFSQKIIVNGQESLGKLSWSDFTGRADKNSSFYAYTSYLITPKFGAFKFHGDSIEVGELEVTLELDPKKSWVKKGKETDELLVHEQGHFNIGILYMREIINNYRSAKFTKANYNSVLQNIMNEARKKYHEMGIKYDEETNHSGNKEQQRNWDQFFLEKLNT